MADGMFFREKPKLSELRIRDTGVMRGAAVPVRREGQSRPSAADVRKVGRRMFDSNVFGSGFSFRTSAYPIFLGLFAHAQHTLEAFLIHSNGDQHDHVADFIAPASLQLNAIQVHLHKVLFDRMLPPLTDQRIDVLIQLAHR